MSVARRVSAAVCFVFPALLALTSDAGPGPPATNVLYGFINANRTLTVAAPGPTYEVLGDVVVNPGATLTVEPGVTLRIAANHDTLQGGDYPDKSEFTVLGSLVAQGAVLDSIRFISSDGSSNSWGRIKVQSTGHLRLSHCSISGCISAVYAPSGTATIQASLLQGGWSGGAPDNTVGIQGGENIDTTAPDTNSVEATIVSGFCHGVQGVPARNLVATCCYTGFNCTFVTYCTAVANNYGFRLCNTVINSIAVANAYGVYSSAGSNSDSYVDYCDSWNNTFNLFGGYTCGTYVASFNPFFLDPTQGDFRLAANSVFKNYSKSGWEIGAYGPGNTPTVAARATSWGALKSLYR